MSGTFEHKTDLIAEVGRLGVHDHVCLIYESQEERLATIIPFMAIGLERGEQCVYVVDDNTSEQVLAAMRKAGIDVDPAIAEKAFQVITKREACLKQGFFDPDWMIDFLKEATEAAISAGFTALRVTGEMTRVLGGEQGCDRLMEYEAKLNYFFPDNAALAICQYNRERFAPREIADVIRTHPLVIYGSMVCENPHYVPPDEFLKPEAERDPAEVDRLLRSLVDRARAESEARASEGRYAELLASLADAVIRCEIESDGSPGKLLEVNDAACSMLGYSRDELLDMDWKTIEVSDSLNKRQEVAGSSFAKAQTAVKSVLLSKTGDRLEVEISARPVNDHGRMTMLAVAHDVTARNRAEEALRCSEIRYRRLFETARDGIFLLEAETGRIVDVNPSLTDMLGYEPEELLGKGPWDVGLFADEAASKRAFSELRRTGNARRDDLLLRAKDGHFLDVELVGNVCSVGQTKIIRCNFRDIAERVHLEQLKSDFLAMVSHELRTPLAVVLGYAQVIEGLSGSEQNWDLCIDAARHIRERGTSMAQLIESLLEISEIQSGAFRLSVHAADIGRLVRQTAQGIPLSGDQKVEIHIEDGLPAVVCDARRLSTALGNIVSNAIKFSPKKGTVRVCARRDRDEILLSVSDEGRGIAVRDRARVFERFTQLDMSSTRTYSGVGMGLYVASQVVDAHGGRITVADGPLGMGAEFKIRIPMAPPQSDELAA